MARVDQRFGQHRFSFCLLLQFDHSILDELRPACSSCVTSYRLGQKRDRRVELALLHVREPDVVLRVGTILNRSHASAAILRARPE